MHGIKYLLCSSIVGCEKANVHDHCTVLCSDIRCRVGVKNYLSFHSCLVGFLMVAINAENIFTLCARICAKGLSKCF